MALIVALLLVLDEALLDNLIRGIVLRRQELASMGLRDAALGDAERALKGRNGPGRYQEGSSLPPASRAVHARAMMLTLDEAAGELRVSATTVKRLIRAGKLRTVKVEGATRVRRSDLEAYVAGLDGAPRLSERLETKA